MRIQHNIMAMNAYRNYTNNVSAMQKNLEKLSSGYKINRAGDDAAGLAISEKMRAQITGLETAQKNAKDGISLVQTAEGALTEVHDMLNRMVELATQSANGTYDNDTDRAQLQKELDQLRDEINRIADSSNFNGIALLDGTMEAKTAVNDATNVTITPILDGKTAAAAQKGVFKLDLSQMTWTNTSTAAADATINIKIGTSALLTTPSTAAANNGTYTGKEFAEALMAQVNDNDGKIEIMGDEYEVELLGDGVLQFTQVNAADLNADALTVTQVSDTDTQNNQGYVQAITVTTEGVSSAGRLYAQGTFDLADLNIQDGSTLKIGDTTYVFAVGAGSKYAGYDNVVDLTDQTKAVIDSNADLSKIAAERLSAVADNNANLFVETDANSSVVYLTEKEGGIDYNVNNLSGSDGKGTYDTGNATHLSTDWKGLVQSGTIDDANTTRGLTLQIGPTADSYNQLRINISDCHTDSLGIAGIDISTQEGAQAAIDAIKNAVNYVSDVRGTLGATQNRLEHTINNLSVMTENIQDAESTIRDTDVAEEMMAYTKNNILIQSAQAMLAQANQVPQGVLQLLQ